MDRIALPNFPRDVTHLIGRSVPAVALETASGERIDLSTVSGTTIIFMQPGSSAAITPVEGWVDRIKQIPGAAGCTGQCKAFQTTQGAFMDLGIRVVGISGQSPTELAAVRQSLGISYELASDASATFLSELGMRPVMYASPDGQGNKPYHPRMLLVVKDGTIVDAKVPDLTPEGASNSAQQLLEQLRAQG